MKTSLYSTGYCKQLEAFSIRGGRWGYSAFPGIFAMIEHPEHGLILFDTGYSERFYEATKRFPYSLYRWTTPVNTRHDRSAAEHVIAAGYSPQDVRAIIISHFHADHICGLDDFPEAEFICSRAAFQALRPLKGMAAVKRAFLPELLPAGFEERARWIETSLKSELSPAFAPFQAGYDLFGDGTLIALALPGHADHQFGVIVQGQNHKAVLLGADASWSLLAVRENRLPHPLAFLVFDQAKPYKETFARLVELNRNNPELRLVFTHCEEALSLCGGLIEGE